MKDRLSVKRVNCCPTCTHAYRYRRVGALLELIYRKLGNFRVKIFHVTIFRVKIFSYTSRPYENILTTKIFQ